MRLLPLLLSPLIPALCILLPCQSVPPGAPLPRIDSPPVVLFPQTPTHIPVQPRARVNTDELKTEASELLELSQSIMPDIEEFSRGVLKKEAVENLKRIEKLSKRLRAQITQ